MLSQIKQNGTNWAVTHWIDNNGENTTANENLLKANEEQQQQQQDILKQQTKTTHFEVNK